MNKLRLKLGSIQQKILLLLLGGIVLSTSYSPKKQLRLIKAVRKEWTEIDQRSLARAIKKLYQSKLVETRENADGSSTLVLSEEGERRALSFKIGEMKIEKPASWDGKWRVVTFDIPEFKRKIRDALRWNLQRMGFYELQKSVFVHPYLCEKEIEFLVEFYDIRRNVRQLLVEKIDNELHLKKIFKLA